MSNPKGTRGSLESRLMSRVAKQPSGCWEWLGYIRPHGYGQIGAGARSQGVLDTHRASWIVHRGPIPDGLWVLHTCDNRKCVNPDHLYLGTHRENTRDRVERGRGSAARGESSGQCKLTDAQVAEIRQRHVRGTSRADRGNTAQLAAEYGVTPQYIGQLSRNVWRNVS